MKLEDMTADLAKQIGARNFTQDRTKDPYWTRIFVVRPDGATIARFSFHNSELVYHKWYKDKLTGHKISIDKADEIKYRFQWVLCTGLAMSKSQFEGLRHHAELLSEILWRKKVKKRKALPTHRPDGKRYKRKALEPTSARQCMGEVFVEALKLHRIL